MLRALQGLGTGGCVHDQLGQQRIEGGCDACAWHDAGIHAQAFAGRFFPGQHRACAGREIPGCVFGANAQFDGAAVQFYVVLGEAEFFAGGDAELLRHQIEAGDGLGDGVFHLQARVHFKEIECAGAVNEFHRAGVSVACGGGNADSGFAYRLALGLREAGGRRFFGDFLEAALQ